MTTYSADDLEAWRAWSRAAPAGALNDFLSKFDAGETELHVLKEMGGGKKKFRGRFIVEVHELQEKED